jgi:mono/diheme cytochrome c family protein
MGACSDCHQSNLAGGTIPFSDPGTVPAANLTPGGELVGWTADDFIKAVQEGVKPSGAALSEAMPRYGTSAEDLAAIFAYLQTLPALPMNQ